MKVAFTLTMPMVGSWNGRWSGAGSQYHAIQTMLKPEEKARIKELLNGEPEQNYWYDFGDGWSVNIQMRIVTAPEAKKLEKVSAGFLRYGWMIGSILENGKIVKEREAVK